MVLKLKILTCNKTKETWLNEALEEYLKRLSPVLLIEFITVKNDEQLLALSLKEPRLICLDPEGKLFSSEEFSKFIMQEFTLGGSKLCVVIGGPEGLPKRLKEHPNKISLSPLVLTHQMVRLLFVEQLYRAFEIMKGSKYHK